MANAVCAACKAKKKRCIHRDLPVDGTEAENNAIGMTNPPAPAVKGRRKVAENVKATENAKAIDNAKTAKGKKTADGIKVAEGKKTADDKTADDKKTTKDEPMVSHGPVDSSDELSSAPSEIDEDLAGKVLKKRIHRSKATVSQDQHEAPNLPTDPVEAACVMSIHSVFARELQAQIDEFNRDLQASRQSHIATMVSAQAIQRTITGWMEAWTSGR